MATKKPKQTGNKQQVANKQKLISKTTRLPDVGYTPVSALPVIDFDKAKDDVLKQRKNLTERMNSLKVAYKNGSFPIGGKDALIRSLFIFSDTLSDEIIKNATAMIDLVQQTYTIALEMQNLSGDLERLLMLYGIKVSQESGRWYIIIGEKKIPTMSYSAGFIEALKLLLPSPPDDVNADIISREQTLLSLEQEYAEITAEIKRNNTSAALTAEFPDMVKSPNTVEFISILESTNENKLINIDSNNTDSNIEAVDNSYEAKDNAE